MPQDVVKECTRSCGIEAYLVVEEVVVGEVHEDLGRACVGARGCEGDGAPLVRLLGRVVVDVGPVFIKLIDGTVRYS